MPDVKVNEISPLVFHSARVPMKTDNRPRWKKRLATVCILLAIGFERLTFYSLSGTLILFLTSEQIGWTSLHGIIASLIFYGTSHVAAIIFSWISDARFGRARTVLLGFVWYIIGYVLFAVFSREGVHGALCGASPAHSDDSPAYFDEKCSGRITAALIVTAIGVGAVETNMVVLGAEQTRDPKATTQYFDRYYLAANAGSLVAFAVIAYIQQNKSYFLGYCISTGMLGVTVAFFLLGYRFYTRVKPHDSVITNFFPVLLNACNVWRMRQQSMGGFALRRRSSHKAMQTNNRFSFSDSGSVSLDVYQKPKSFLDYAKVEYNGRFQDRIVDDIKSLRRIVIMFLLLIPYWLLYLQGNTTFIVQGVHMRIPRIHPDTSRMPVLWLSLSDQVVIILIICALDFCVYKRHQTTSRVVSIKLRFIIGMSAAALSLCLAGITEVFRQRGCDSPLPQIIGNTVYNTSDMSVFYQLPQYISMGVSEVFASVASLEFAYLTAPQSAQSFVMSLRFCSLGLSSFLGSGYINIYNRVYNNFSVTNSECQDAKEPQLFYIYFFVLAAVQLLFLVIFLGCDRRFRLIKASEHRFNTRLFISRDSSTPNT